MWIGGVLLSKKELLGFLFTIHPESRRGLVAHRVRGGLVGGGFFSPFPDQCVKWYGHERVWTEKEYC